MFNNGEIDAAEYSERMHIREVFQSKEMERIKLYHDLKLANLDHMEWLPEFGFFYLNIEQIVILITSDASYRGLLPLENGLDDSSVTTMKRDLKASEKVYEKFPERMKRRLMAAVESGELPHIRAPKRFVDFATGKDETPSLEIYVHFEDLCKWLYKVQYVDKQSLRGKAIVELYELIEGELRKELLCYARVLRVMSVVHPIGDFESIIASESAKAGRGERKDIKHWFALDTLREYWEKYRNRIMGATDAETPLLPKAKYSLLKLVRALARMNPIDLNDIHSTGKIIKALHNEGLNLDEDTVRQYIKEAMTLKGSVKR